MNRPLFASWLIEQVTTGQYKGLQYVNQNQFRVPWKHNSRKDCSDEDSKIFRAWAVCSGKIVEYPNDKAKWKTNFRCTLNNLTKRFKMVGDYSKNSEDPHKIYEIINNEYDYEGGRTEPTPKDDDDMVPDIYCSPVEEFPTGIEPDYGANPGAEFLVPPQPNIFDLEVSIHYRGKLMSKQQVSCHRLQLHYQHPSPELDAHPLCFPSTQGLLDHKQIHYTNHILNNIQKGLVLEVRNNGIYAIRQGSCHVFACTHPSEAYPDPTTLPKCSPVELLSFENYINELKLFGEHKRGSPDYTIQMCFGEKFPDGRPQEKKLVVVKVVPLICRHFHELAQAEGASSLLSDNISLQISNSLFDLISSFMAATDLP
ncbi:interferon regulatory factor 7 [Aplochiton taeniatus]